MPVTVQACLRVRKPALHSNRSYCYAFRSRAAPTNTSPPVSPGGEMITQRFGSTKDFAKEWNNRVYFRLSKMLCGFKDQVRARPSGETGGLHPAPASRDPGEKCGLIRVISACPAPLREYFFCVQLLLERGVFFFVIYLHRFSSQASNVSMSIGGAT